VKAPRLTSDQWTQFWRRDSVTTFARQFNTNYDGEFGEFWDRQFSALPRGARIVDLATGNGAIALLAQQYSIAHAAAFEVIGIDYAEIDPARVLAGHADLAPLLAHIDFRRGVRIEATGLPNGCADLLTSQYGFEYGERDAALAEARRVLAPGGRMALIVHHRQSTVVELAREGLSQVRLCLQKEEIDKRVTALVKAMGEAASAADRSRLKANPKTERLRQKINASIARINQRAERYRDPEGFIGVVVPNFLKVFGEHKNASLNAKLKYLRDVRESFDAFRERMADLTAAALSPEDFDGLIAACEAAGLGVVERGLLHYNGDLMGWTLVLNKPEGGNAGS
jgi:ubiquinone/menaquinone biosynthesis C-methylase UbiE